LAPLYGILRDALKNGHSGPIWLFHGGRNPFSLYLKDQLTEISLLYPNFQYRPCVLSDGTDTIPQIAIDQHILKNFQDLKNARIYLCGDPSLVNTLRKKLFLAGASSKEIYADPFLPSAAPIR
jgi:NAD(P)H-flavin reductase